MKHWKLDDRQPSGRQCWGECGWRCELSMWTTRKPCVPTLPTPPAPPVPQWWRGWEALAYRMRGAVLQVWHAKHGCSTRNLSSQRWTIWIPQTWLAAVKPAHLTGSASALVILLQRAHRWHTAGLLRHALCHRLDLIGVESDPRPPPQYAGRRGGLRRAGGRRGANLAGLDN